MSYSEELKRFASVHTYENVVVDAGIFLLYLKPMSMHRLFMVS